MAYMDRSQSISTRLRDIIGLGTSGDRAASGQQLPMSARIKRSYQKFKELIKPFLPESLDDAFNRTAFNIGRLCCQIVRAVYIFAIVHPFDARLLASTIIIPILVPRSHISLTPLWVASATALRVALSEEYARAMEDSRFKNNSKMRKLGRQSYLQRSWVYIQNIVEDLQELSYRLRLTNDGKIRTFSWTCVGQMIDAMILQES